MRSQVVAVVVVIALSLLSAHASPASPRVSLERFSAFTEGWSLGARAAGASPLTLHVFIKQRDVDVLEETLYAVSDPRSSSYGAHLSNEEVHALVAPKREDLSAVLHWLQAHGVDVVRDVDATPNGDILEVRTNVATAEKLLEAEYRYYHHEVSGGRVLRTQGYTVPAAVAQAIDFVGPTVRLPTNLVPQAMAVDAAQAPQAFVTPSVLRSLYSVGDYTSQSPNNSLALTGFLNQFISSSDLATFFKQYDQGSVGRKAIIHGPNEQSSPGIEANLDIQYGMAMGAGVANAYFWSTAGQQPGNPENEPFLKFLFDVSNTTDAPRVFSISYGDNEDTVDFAYAVRVNAEFQKAGARGITILASSGDGGVSGGQPSSCPNGFNPTFPAASPYVTAVGGTTGSNPEVAASLSSGGFSNRWDRPSYQKDAVSQYFATVPSSKLPPSKDYNQTGAGFPDIAAQAENFAIVIGGFSTSVAGTSCSSPTNAGIIALLNDVRMQAGKSTLGWINPLVYQNADAFNDITEGTNPGCFTDGFTAATGWDPVTGVGTLNFAKLKTVVESL